MQFGFIGPSYTPRSKFVSPEILVNRYLEVNEANQGTTPTKWSAFERPGYLQLNITQAMGAPSAFAFSDLNQVDLIGVSGYAAFAIAGGKFWGLQILPTSPVTVAATVLYGAVSQQMIGTGGGGAFPSTLIVINPNLVFAASNGVAYVFGTQIVTYSVSNGGAGYAVGDSGTLGQGIGAAYVVTGETAGVATAVTVTTGGTLGFQAGAVCPTATGGTQPGTGIGLTIAVNSVQWNGSTVEIPNGTPGYYVSSATFIDNYVIATIASEQDPLRRQFFVSNEGDPTTWQPLEYGTKEANPDPNVNVFAANELLIVAGSQTTELWEDTGALNFQFQRVQGGGVLETGVVAFGSTMTKVGDGTVCFLGTDARGQNIAWRLNGRSLLPISNFAIESAWYSYDTTGANAYVAQHEGHYFYVVNFPIPDKTWVCDLTSLTWAQWCLGNWQDTASYGDLGRYHIVIPGVGHLVLDKTGNIYLQLIGLNSDAGTPIHSLRRSPILQSEARRMNFNRVRLYADVGNNAAVQYVDARMSYDGGNNWGTSIALPIQPGAYQTLLEWLHMGYGRYNSVEISSQGGEAWIDGYCDVTVGST